MPIQENSKNSQNQNKYTKEMLEALADLRQRFENASDRAGCDRSPLTRSIAFFAMLQEISSETLLAEFGEISQNHSLVSCSLDFELLAELAEFCKQTWCVVSEIKDFEKVHLV